MGLGPLLKGAEIGGVPVLPIGLAVGAAGLAYRTLDLPARRYNREQNTVGKEYDAWTTDGVLEHYWGEHIHLGYYTEEEMQKG